MSVFLYYEQLTNIIFLSIIKKQKRTNVRIKNFNRQKIKKKAGDFMLDIKVCPLCRQELEVSPSALEGEFVCPQCKSRVCYKRHDSKKQQRLTMHVHTPEDIDVMQRRYGV